MEQKTFFLIVNQISAGKLPEIKPKYSDAIKKLFSSMISTNSRTRISIDKLKNISIENLTEVTQNLNTETEKRPSFGAQTRLARKGTVKRSLQDEFIVDSSIEANISQPSNASQNKQITKEPIIPEKKNRS